MQFRTVFSNRVEELYIEFRETILHLEKFPFARRLVIVPSPALKTWLMLQMAKDPDAGIAMGLEISYLDQSVQKLKNLFWPRLSGAKLPMLWNWL